LTTRALPQRRAHLIKEVLDLAFRGEAAAELLLAPAAGVLADVDGEGPRERGAAAPVARATQWLSVVHELALN
jgi:hypothetical protein